MDYDEMKVRMNSGKLYFCEGEEMMVQQLACLDKVFAYNQLRPGQQKEKSALLKEMFARIGDECYIETPFQANWGGKHTFFGSRVYANYNLVLVDDCEIHVGDDVMMGPNVVLCSGTHPISPELRRKKAQYNLPVHIGNNVWLGANCIVLPGVTIGENSVIGAGSVVTKDIPSNVVAVGCPCRVLREIDERDRMYYNGGNIIDIG